MPSLSYDLVVVGDDFAGLVCACLCASRGLRVLLAETQRPQRSYSFDSETLPLEPGYLAGIRSPAAARVIGELNFEHLFKRRVHAIDPPCQLLAHDLRLEVETEEDSLAQSLRREMGQDATWLLDSTGALQDMPGLLSSEACMPPTGFWERRELAKHLEAMHERSDEWHQRAHGQQSTELLNIAVAALCGHQATDALSRAHGLEILRQGLSEAEGDCEAWRSIFLEKFKSHNGEVRRVDPQAIDHRWGKVVGLRTLEDDIRCDYMVAAMPVSELADIFGDKAPKKLLEVAGQIRPLAYRYILNLLVHWNGLPEGMGQVAWSQLKADQPATGGNFVSFSVKPGTRAGGAIVTLEGLAPVDESGNAVVAGMREAMMEHARARIPFLDRHIEAIDSPHESADGKHKRDLGGDRKSGLPLRAVWDCPMDAALNLPASPYVVGAKHLCVASSQTLPTLGLPGQFIAGWSAAKLASAGMSKRKSATKPSVLAQSST